MMVESCLKSIRLQVDHIDRRIDVMINCATACYQNAAVFCQMKTTHYLRQVDNCLVSDFIKFF